MHINKTASHFYRSDQIIWRWITYFGVIVFIGFSLAYLFFGLVNVDEGWYLYASKLVWIGQQPYRDFAYTQTPLLPYIYGLVQYIFSPSIYLGRATSIIFSIISLFLALNLSKLYAGEIARAITAILWSTFFFGIYYNTIVKTYAFITFLFLLAIFLLSRDERKNWHPIGVSNLLVLATLVRLSAIGFAIPFIFYAFYISEKKGRLIITTCLIFSFIWILALSFPNPEAMIWNLLKHHTGQWESLAISEMLLVIIKHRIPSFLAWFPGLLLLLIMIIVAGYKDGINLLKHNAVFQLILLGSILFAIPHLATGGWHPDYFVPVIFIMLMMVGIFYAKIYPQKQQFAKMALKILLVSAIILNIIFIPFIISNSFGGSLFFFDLSGNKLPVEEIKIVSKVVSDVSSPSDNVFTLGALYVALEADREPLHGLAMSRFSLIEGETKNVKKLNLVNDQIIFDYINSGAPKVIILLDRDMFFLKDMDYYQRIVAALKKNYLIYYQMHNFGHTQDTVRVYLRRE